MTGLLTQSTSNNCSTGCISCSPLNYCQLCDSSRLLVLQTQIDLNLPYPHKITSCVVTQNLNCAKIDHNDNCLYCNEGFYPKSGVCTQAVVTVPGCLILTHNGICSQCIDNYVLNIAGQCVVVNQEETAGEGCKRIRIDSSKCIECKDSYVMDDLGNCILEEKILPFVGKGLSTFMIPTYSAMENCQLVTRYECKGCSSSNFLSSADTPDYNLFNSVGALQLLANDNSQNIDLESLLQYETPYVISNNNSDTSIVNLEMLENSELYCKSQPIKNCLLQDPYKCLMCENGFELTSLDFCEKSENPPIPNCEIQLTVLKCLKCRNGYFNSHLNLTFCKKSSKVANCETYHSKSDGCKECVSGYVTFNGKCSKRVYSDIENCEVLKFENEGCAKCSDGYALSADYLGCYANIPNCSVHQSGLLGIKGRKGLLCTQCDSGYFIDFSAGHTVTAQTEPTDTTTPETTPPEKQAHAINQSISILNSESTLNSCTELPEDVDPNCELFSKESIVEGNSTSGFSSTSLCQKCKNGYFIHSDGAVNSCKKYPIETFENCSSTSGFKNKKCLECEYQSILLKTDDLCLPPTSPKNCIRYKSPSDCELCYDGYFGESCLAIPEEMNCKKIENEGSGLDLSKHHIG